MKTIWIFNQYNMPPEYGHLNRHFNLGKYLKRKGYRPIVFVGSCLHNSSRQMIQDDVLYNLYEHCEYPYYFIRTCDYSRNRTKRIYAMVEFYNNLFRVTKKLENPDVIIGSSAHPLAAIAAIRMAKKYGCQSVVEIRDLWPESFVAYDIIEKNNPLLKLLYLGEKWIYEKADKLIFTMEGAKDYIIEHGWDLNSGGSIDLSKVYHINNGVDLEVFDYNKTHFQLDDSDLNDPSVFKVVYTGSIRKVNQVGSLLNIAAKLKERRMEDIRFLIWGDGDELEYLKNRAHKEGLNNVLFKGRVDKKYIPYITAQSQLNIALAKNNPLYRFGLSLNKMFEYFAAGRPTLFSFRSGYSLIEKYNAGIELPSDSTERFVDCILFFKNLSIQEYEQYCLNARKVAEEYDFAKLTDKLIKIIET